MNDATHNDHTTTGTDTDTGTATENGTTTETGTDRDCDERKFGALIVQSILRLTDALASWSGTAAELQTALACATASPAEPAEPAEPASPAEPVVLTDISPRKLSAILCHHLAALKSAGIAIQFVRHTDRNRSRLIHIARQPALPHEPHKPHSAVPAAAPTEIGAPSTATADRPPIPRQTPIPSPRPIPIAVFRNAPPSIAEFRRLRASTPPSR